MVFYKKFLIMGIGAQLNKYERDALEYFGMKYDGLVWCELGSQLNRTQHRSAKSVYIKRGVDHTSIDLDGKWGSLKLDLDEAVPDELLNKFDVVTNYGTIEHVNNQYSAFKNMHDMCKVDGIIIHGFPKKETFLGHCRYYYDEEFVDKIARKCSYDIHRLKIIDLGRSGKDKTNHLLTVVFVKTKMEFISEGDFTKLPIFDSGDLHRTGNYTKGRKRKPK